ncbi:hypothetical protein H8957_016680, partial [Semnopithecus entellus]
GRGKRGKMLRKSHLPLCPSLASQSVLLWEAVGSDAPVGHQCSQEGPSHPGAELT